MDYLYQINVCFFIPDIDSEKIYWEYKGSVSNFLNSSLHESLILEFVMILITLFEFWKSYHYMIDFRAILKTDAQEAVMQYCVTGHVNHSVTASLRLQD